MVTINSLNSKYGTFKRVVITDFNESKCSEVKLIKI